MQPTLLQQDRRFLMAPLPAEQSEAEAESANQTSSLPFSRLQWLLAIILTGMATAMG